MKIQMADDRFLENRYGHISVKLSGSRKLMTYYVTKRLTG